MVAKKILDEANKNKAVLDAANKTKEELEAELKRRNQEQTQNMHWQNQQRFIKDQIIEGKNTADRDKLRQEIEPEWNDIIKKAKEWFHGEQAGYETFVSASSAQVNFLCHLAPTAAKKINLTLSDLTRKYDEVLVDLYKALPESKEYDIGRQLLGGMMKKNSSLDPTQYNAPTLKFEIGMDDENVLKIKTLEFISVQNIDLSTQEITKEHVALFQTGIVAWLMENGYTPSAVNAGKFTKNGHDLDDKALQALKPIENLSAYLNDMSKIVNENARKAAKLEADTTNKEKQTSKEAWDKTAKEEKAKKRKEAADRKAEAENDEEAQPSTAPRPK